MKKWTYAILALTLTAGLAACNGSNDETDNNIVFGDNQIGNGEQEFIITHNQTIKKGVYLLKGWCYVTDGATLVIEAGTVIASVLIFIIYYIINNTGYKMARDGNWVVWMGMWTSTAVLAPLGAFLTYKSNNDSVVLNADAYVDWFKKVAGIRSVRHMFRKEVIIVDPDYERIVGDLEKLSADCQAYAQKKKLTKAPNYFTLWMVNKNDHEIEQLNDRMEALVDELSNTRSIVLLNQLNNYPLIPVHAHVRPFDIYWLNILAGLFVPVGLFFYFRIWAFRIRLQKDIDKIIKTSEEITTIIKNNK